MYPPIQKKGLNKSIELVTISDQDVSTDSSQENAI